MNLAHSPEDCFRRHTCEHHKWPGKIRAVQFTQTVEPHEYRSRAPGHRTPPAVLTRAQIVLPALHHQLPLQWAELAGASDAGLMLHASVVQRSENRRHQKRK